MRTAHVPPMPRPAPPAPPMPVEAPSIPLPDDLEAAIRSIEDTAAALGIIADEARECGQVAAIDLAASRAGKPVTLDVADTAARRVKLEELQGQVGDILSAIKRAETEQAALIRTLGTTRDEHKKVSAELEELLSRLARVREQVT